MNHRKMTAVREELEPLAATFGHQEIAAAALAEVEEWEAQLADALHGRDLARLDTEAAERRWTDAIDLLSAAEAEADRLKAALTEYGDHQSWRCGHPDRYSQDPDCCCGLVQTWRDLGFAVEYDVEGRAALAPADRNTT